MNTHKKNEEELNKLFNKKIKEEPSFARQYEFGRYCDNEMNSAENIVFEEKLRTDPMFFNEFQEYKKFNESLGHFLFNEKLTKEITPEVEQQISNDFSVSGKKISSRFVNERMQSFKKIMDDHEALQQSNENTRYSRNLIPDSKSSEKNNKKILLKIIVSVAASVILIAVCAFLINYFIHSKKSSAVLYADNYKYYEFSGIKGVEDKTQNSMDIAITHYRKKDYKTVIAVTDTIASKNDLVHFMNGLALMETGCHEKAILSFGQIIKNTQSQYFNDACWHLGLCCLKTGDKTNAVNYFQILLKTDNIYSAKSKIILEQMER